jgi:heptosyltransferase I
VLAGAPFLAGRVCVVMLSALGDVVHTLPVVTAIKRHVPATRLTWILQPGPATLVRGHPDVDEILMFERRRGWRALLGMRRELRTRPFDLVIDLQPYLKAGIITGFTRAPVKLGLDRARARDLNWLFTTNRIPPRPLGHVQEQFLEFLDAIGVPRGEPAWGLRATEEERARARALVAGADGPLVGLVLASSRRERNWFPDRYADLIAALRRDLGATAVLLGGRSAPESEMAAGILGRAGSRPIDTMGEDLRTMLGLLDACDVVISPDTGPLHMCVAMDVPVVGLYGFTNPKRSGPYRRFGELLIDAYADPGDGPRIDTTYRKGRMQRIAVAQVVERTALALQRYAPAAPWRRLRPPA